VGSSSRWCCSARNARPHHSNIQDKLHVRVAGKVRTPPFKSPVLCSHSNSPRDAVTISRTFNDATTIIDVSTSLPRSPDEPAYLRPSPPYVRSNVKRKDISQSIELIGLTMYMQYSHGVSSHYRPHHLSRQLLATPLRERRIQGACASHASGSTIFVQYGILAL
jgi:hypothetical protein